MYKPSNFIENLSNKLLILAAQKNQDYVLLDGVLKKGTWKTLPNHVHIFIVDGKIQAGPADTIGKSPDELDWNKVAEDEKAQHPNPYPVREEVTQKYRNEMMALASIKRKDVRNQTADKIMRKMAAEDEFHCVFLNTNGKPSPLLEDLSKVFADFGKFPLHGSFKDQMIFYNDRLSLLGQLKKSVPEEAQKDVQIQFNHLQEHISRMQKRGPSGYPVGQENTNTLNKNHQTTSSPPPSPGQTPSPNQATRPTQQQQQQQQSRNDPSQQSSPGKQKSHPGVHQVTHTVTKPNKSNNKIPSSPRLRQNVNIPNKKSIRAKSSLAMQIESGLRGLFGFMVGSIALWLTKALKNSDNDANKMLYSVTKHIISNINVSERDNFYDVFQKSFGLF
jgi:hypothetical protein